MNKSQLIRFCLILNLICFLACNTEAPLETPFTVRVCLSDEPDRLNPILSSTVYGTHINHFLFQTLAEFDPFTIEYRPVLLDELSLPVTVEEGPWIGESRYSFRIRSNAKWDNGSPISAHDVLFTAKCGLLPQCGSGGLAPYIESILDFSINENDPLSFIIIVNKEYLLALEASTNWQILPKYHYDSEEILDKYSFAQIRYPDQHNLDLSQDSLLNYFFESFGAEEMSRSNISGSGAYRLVDWQANQYVSLEKKTNWWGEALVNRESLFTNNPQRIVFQIISDEQVAVTALKEGNVDLVEINVPANFVNLQKSVDSNLYTFHAPRQYQYFYFAMNNQHPILKEVEIRKAVAHVLNVDEVIESQMLGLAQRTVGPINPFSPNYNQELSPVEYNLEKAKAYLSQAGWEDTNQNGTVDKVINGNLTECILRVFITSGQLGRNISLILKEAAEKVGIQIDIVQLSAFPEVLEHINVGDFELATLGAAQSSGDYDPFQNWHTESYLEQSGNKIGFGNAESDRIIEQLREEVDPVKRRQWYYQFQEKVYDQQPVLFLFSPSKLYITHNRINVQESIERPGYFENYFKLNPQFADQ